MSQTNQRKWIAIDQETYKNLARQGTVSDTFDSVIRKLLDKMEKAS